MRNFHCKVFLLASILFFGSARAKSPEDYDITFCELEVIMIDTKLELLKKN